MSDKELHRALRTLGLALGVHRSATKDTETACRDFADAALDVIQAAKEKEQTPTKEDR